MGLLKSSVLRFSSFISFKVQFCRNWSWKGNGRDESSQGESLKDPVRQVFISQSHDIFANLALEDWLYRHHDFQHKHLLLLWRNSPCVVVGKHQNPWVEANVPFLRKHNINLARRNSGGGTVYHDLGNINCTFFTQRDAYRRRHNLDIIKSSIQRLTSLNISVNDRGDIVLNETKKISGTAARLGRLKAYHHCTVLVDVNACVLHDSLNSKAINFETRATQSVRVPVQNIKEVCPTATVESILEAIGWEFLRTDIRGNDIGINNDQNRGFQRVRPDDGWYPGLGEIQKELKSYDWIFGKTPKFEVKKKFPTPRSNGDVEISLTVVKGLIQDVNTKLSNGVSEMYDLSEVLVGREFTKDLPEAVDRSLATINVEDKEFLVNIVKGLTVNVA